MAVSYNYGAAPTYVKIASYTATTSTSSYTFTNIPQGYTDLVLVTSGIGSGTENLECYINGDTGNNYSFTYLYGDGTTAASGRNANANRIVVGRLGTGTSHGIAHFQNYSHTLTNKTILTRKGKGSEIGMIFSNIWRNTSPITSLQIFGAGSPAKTMSAGYTATLYGIKAALVPKATGGDFVIQDGTYWYHAFRTTGAFTTRQALSADILTVAGGGAGGSVTGGGGGAGGYVYLTSQSLTSGVSSAVTVGAGGTASYAAFAGAETNGNNSQFASLTAAVGGGKGGRYNGTAGNQYAPAAGGSGGGGGGKASTNITGGAGTSGQGFAGGSSTNGGTAAGGGGAGGVGENGTSNSTAAAGGPGINTYSTFITPVGIGINGYFGGGGGGSADTGGGTGGVSSSSLGGGGTSGVSMPAGTIYNGGRGAAFTGSGGGGGAGGYAWGGNGGSGFVVVRYSI
jgi:hypothetical protein